jgi:hypothetical protein
MAIHSSRILCLGSATVSTGVWLTLFFNTPHKKKFKDVKSKLHFFFVGFVNLKLNLTNVMSVTGTIAKEIAAKQPELPFQGAYSVIFKGALKF